MQYQPHLPRVLDGVSLSVRGGEKVGICGRTGAGKRCADFSSRPPPRLASAPSQSPSNPPRLSSASRSSFFQALLRLADAATLHGSIAIDAVDCFRIGVADLRRAVAVIPQEGTLFAGTLRYNLDPLGEHPDDELWGALELAQLRGVVRAGGKGLDGDVAEDGGNWSQGQRQLLCLARAALRRRRIALLDEASSSTDAATDALLQQAIRAAFREATVLTIAHRLHTVADSDRVLVLERGKVAEFDSPAALLARPGGSIYRALLEETSRGAAGMGGATTAAAAAGGAPAAAEAPLLVL